MSLFFGLNISLKGMMAQQTAMNVTSHNIANANTEGYSRQRVNLETSEPISGLTTAGQLGSGVDVAEVTRVRDEFIDYQFRNETSSLEYHTAVSTTLAQVETVFMEPSENGFNDQLEELWSAWQDLANTPESSPVRTALKETAVSLTDTIRQMSGQLTDINNDIQNQIDLKIDDVNTIAEKIAALNEEIVSVKLSGDSPNDLMDSRDLALDELAALGNITVTECVDGDGKATGAIEVQLGTKLIVDEEDGAIPITSADIDSTTVTNGALAGLLQVGGDSNESNTVQFYIDKLNTLAVGIAKSVNDIHTTGVDLDENSGENFFVFKDADGNEIDMSGVDWDDPFSSGLSAANIYINPDIEDDVSKIAASQQDDIFLEGNGDIALQIADLRDANMEYDSATRLLTSSSAGDLTIGMFYQDMVTELGSATSSAEKKVENQQTLVDQTESRRESVRGVSLDEETANMVLYQHAFDASAKVISVIDEMLDTVINGLKA